MTSTVYNVINNSVIDVATNTLNVIYLYALKCAGR